MTTALARSALRRVTTDLLAPSESALVDEVALYASSPFAHLEATEEWHTPLGEPRQGHIFVPHVETLEDVPLVPFPPQRALLNAWIVVEPADIGGVTVRFRNVHVEKSRQMGFTWALAYACWWLLTYHVVQLGYSNMTASEVDDGGSASTTDSFFGKIRHIHGGVPGRFRAPLVFRGGNDPLIRNLERPRSFLVGEGATSSPGRGGRYSAWIIDEAARFAYGESAHSALARAVPNGRLYNSTPDGEGNVYFRLRDERPRGYVFERHHWQSHPVYGALAHVAADVIDPTGEDPSRPRTVAQAVKQNIERQPTAAMTRAAKACPLCRPTAEGVRWTAETRAAHRFPGKLTSPWYEDAVEDLTDEQVAAELDIDYTASLSARVYPEFSEDMHVVDRIPYDPEIEDVAFWIDYGLDVTAIGILQETPTELRQIGELEVADADPEAVVRELRRTLLMLGVRPELVDPSSLWLGTNLAVGDPAGAAREVGSGETIEQKYAQAGLNVVSPGVRRISTTVLGVKRLLRGKPRRYLIARDRCPQTIRHWKLNRWPVDRDGNRKAGVTQPVDDEHNHMCFVAGTMVTTARGEIPIESVRVGDYALTRVGWRPVVAAGPTGRRRTLRVGFEGGEITGTPEHPVWIVGEGWRRLDEVRPGSNDSLLVVVEVPDPDVASVTKKAAHDTGLGVVVDVQANGPGVVATTGRGRLLADRAAPALPFEKGVVLARGEAVLRPEPIGAVAVAAILEPPGALSRAASAAGRVATLAGIPRTPDRGAADLAVGGTGVLEHARVLYVDPDDTIRRDVYNLSVSGTPEFFANGALVHNCRAAAYYVSWRWPIGDDPVKAATTAATRPGKIVEGVDYDFKF